MKDLIKALEIFAKYANPRTPTHCEHDILIMGDEWEEDTFTEEEKKET